MWTWRMRGGQGGLPLDVEGEGEGGLAVDAEGEGTTGAGQAVNVKA